MGKTRIALSLLFLTLCFVWVSCEDTDQTNPISRENSGQSGKNKGSKNSKGNGGDADSDSDMDADADEDIDEDTGEEVCLDLDFNIEPLPIRMMILQDISGSMRNGNPPKWQQAKAAISSVTEKYKKNIDFGFDVFPNNGTRATPNNPNGGCRVNLPLKLDCARNNVKAIGETLAGININPQARTPLWAAMANFTVREYAPEFTNGRFASYLLVISDGNDTCASAVYPVDGGVEAEDDTPAPVTGGGPLAGLLQGATASQLGALSATLAEKSINTFVIGFGNDISNPAQLDAIAKNGGTGIETHLNAADEEALKQTLTDIVYKVISCNYEIGETDATMDVNKANFFFDDKVVGRDDDCAKNKGWTWTDKSMSKVMFCEGSCQKLKNGKISTVTAQFGCPSTIIY